MQSGHAAHDVVTVDDHLEDPRSDIVAERDLSTGHSNHRDRPSRWCGAEQTHQFIARNRARRADEGRARLGERLRSRSQRFRERIVALCALHPVQAEELPHRHSAQAVRLRVLQHLFQPDHTVDGVRRDAADRVVRERAGLAPRRLHLGPDQDAPQPVHRAQVGIDLFA
jgi:hypothetical protein